MEEFQRDVIQGSNIVFVTLRNKDLFTKPTQPKYAFDMFNQQSMLQPIATLHATILELIKNKHTPSQLIHQTMQKLVDNNSFNEQTMISVLRRSNLNPNDVMKWNGELHRFEVNTTSLTLIELERLYTTIYEENTLVKSKWVQCDHCNKWRRLACSTPLEDESDWYCSMILVNGCDEPEELMGSDEQCVDLTTEVLF